MIDDNCSKNFKDDRMKHLNKALIRAVGAERRQLEEEIQERNELVYTEDPECKRLMESLFKEMDEVVNYWQEKSQEKTNACVKE